jgi:hypothetical protein
MTQNNSCWVSLLQPYLQPVTTQVQRLVVSRKMPLLRIVYKLPFVEILKLSSTGLGRVDEVHGLYLGIRRQGDEQFKVYFFL